MHNLPATISKRGSIALLFLLAFCMQAASPAYLPAEESQETRQTYQNLEIFANALALLQQYYVDEVDTEAVIRGAVDGMLNTLDPHSSYLSPEDFTQLEEETNGSFTGIGIEIALRDKVLTVVSPIEGTPACKKGLKAGDQIMSIDGENTKNMSLFDAVKKLKGKINTDVTLTIYRKSWPGLRDITITRDRISLHSIQAYLLEPGIGYIKITSFQTATTRDFRKNLRKLRKKKPIKGLVLDLRNNPGGLLDQAVNVADVFLDDGLIVTTRGRKNNEQQAFSAHKNNARDNYPVIVLVNEGTASGSEIVAGALQDHKRAIILGTTTFGKGSVQTILPMPDGSAIRLTTARYYTPEGRSIQATGIVPDIIVPLAENKEDTAGAQHGSALRELDLPGHLLNRQTRDKKPGPQISSELSSLPEDIQQKIASDNQLQTALIILKSLELSITADGQ